MNISSAYSKARRRIIPLLIMMSAICYIDRVNVSFAQLTMQNSLNFSDFVYATGAGVFFWGYLIFEIPSNIFLKRVGAKVWFTRIMITWGIATMALALVKTPTQFYLVRFFIGLAEAGFFPGVIFYLNLWFEDKEIVKATSLFYISIPLAGIIGGPIAGFIFAHLEGFLNIASWQYLFITEGLMPVGMAVFIIFLLPDTPAKAKWLTQEEKDYISKTQDVHKKLHSKTDFKKLFSPEVIIFTIAVFMQGAGLFTIFFWLPQFLKNIGIVSNSKVSLYTSLIWVVVGIIIILVGRSSTYFRDRRWHITVFGLLCFFAYLILYFCSNIYLEFIMITLACVGNYAVLTLVWGTVGSFMEAASMAVMVAFINSVGNMSGYVSPILVAWIKTTSGDIKLALLLVGGISLLIEVVIIQFLNWKQNVSLSQGDSIRELEGC